LVLFGITAHDEILIFAPASHFQKRVVEAQLQLFGSFGPAFVEALRESLHARRCEENINEGACDLGVTAVPDRARTLDVDINEDIRAVFEVVLDGVFAGAVKIAVNFGVFQQVCVCDFFLELSSR
jgi:hypothetical protein